MKCRSSKDGLFNHFIIHSFTHRIEMVRLSLLLIPFLIIACDRGNRKKVSVHPIKQELIDSAKVQLMPFDTHPYIEFGKKLLIQNKTKDLPDRSFTNRLRLNKNMLYPFDPSNSFPAIPLEVVMPDAVRYGDFFYYVLVLKSRKNALFSRVHTEQIADSIYQIRAYHQEIEGLPDPCSDYEENIISFQPDQKGRLTFQYYFYDSLYVERQIVVY